MAELDVIAETLRRQREDLAELIENASSRSDATNELVTRIEDLRRRIDATQHRFDVSMVEAAKRKE